MLVFFRFWLWLFSHIFVCRDYFDRPASSFFCRLWWMINPTSSPVYFDKPTGIFLQVLFDDPMFILIGSRCFWQALIMIGPHLHSPRFILIGNPHFCRFWWMISPHLRSPLFILMSNPCFLQVLINDQPHIFNPPSLFNRQALFFAGFD